MTNNNYVQFGETFEFDGERYVLRPGAFRACDPFISECSMDSYSAKYAFLWGPNGGLINEDWTDEQNARLMRCIRREGEFAPGQLTFPIGDSVTMDGPREGGDPAELEAERCVELAQVGLEHGCHPIGVGPTDSPMATAKTYNKYPTVDPAELEPEYSEHLHAMPYADKPMRWAAAQLALRDREIERLKQELEDYDICRGAVLRKNLESERDAALARLEHSADWHQQRYNRVRKWVEEEVRPLSGDVANRYYAIVANGSPSPYEPADWADTLHAARLERDAALARIRELTEWRPVETAPHTTILVLAKAGHVVALHHKPGDRWEGDWTSDELIGWLPLPEAPHG